MLPPTPANHISQRLSHKQLWHCLFNTVPPDNFASLIWDRYYYPRILIGYWWWTTFLSPLTLLPSIFTGLKLGIFKQYLLTEWLKILRLRRWAKSCIETAAVEACLRWPPAAAVIAEWTFLTEGNRWVFITKPQWARTEPVSARCYEHRADTGPVLAHCSRRKARIISCSQ